MSTLPLLTTSSVKKYRACQRSYFFSYERCIRAIQRDGNLHFGTLMHSAIETWRRTAMKTSDQGAWLVDALAVLQKEDDLFERAKAEALMLGYHARWADAPGEWLAVETEFTGPLLNPETDAPSKTWRRGGKIDAVMRVDGRTYTVETKTSGEDISRGSPYWERLTLDPQISNYLQGARWLGFDVAGCMYDVVGKPGLRPFKATPEADRQYRKTDGALIARQRARDEAPEEYRNRLLEDISAHPDAYFQRGEVVRIGDEERAAAFDVWQVGQQIRDARRLNVWPRNPDACRRYGRTCEYLPVCLGVADIEDPTRYRQAETPHEELSAA